MIRNRILFYGITLILFLLNPPKLTAQGARPRSAYNPDYLDKFEDGGTRFGDLLPWVIGIIIAISLLIKIFSAPLQSAKVIFYFVVNIFYWYGGMFFIYELEGPAALIAVVSWLYVGWRYIFVGLSESLESREEKIKGLRDDYRAHVAAFHGEPSMTFAEYAQYRTDIKVREKASLRFEED